MADIKRKTPRDISRKVKTPDIDRKTPEDDETRRLCLKYSHVETLWRIWILAATVVGGIVCMISGIQGGKDIVIAVLGFSAGYEVHRSAKRNIHESK